MCQNLQMMFCCVYYVLVFLFIMFYVYFMFEIYGVIDISFNVIVVDIIMVLKYSCVIR